MDGMVMSSSRASTACSWVFSSVLMARASRTSNLNENQSRHRLCKDIRIIKYVLLMRAFSNEI